MRSYEHIVVQNKNISEYNILKVLAKSRVEIAKNSTHNFI